MEEIRRFKEEKVKAKKATEEEMEPNEVTGEEITTKKEAEEVNEDSELTYTPRKEIKEEPTTASKIMETPEAVKAPSKMETPGIVVV